MLAAGMLREARRSPTALVGEVIPSDVPGKLAMGVRAPAGVVVGDRAVERAGDPLARARSRRRSRSRNTVVLKASELCPRTHAARRPARSSTPGFPPG